MSCLCDAGAVGPQAGGNFVNEMQRGLASGSGQVQSQSSDALHFQIALPCSAHGPQGDSSRATFCSPRLAVLVQGVTGSYETHRHKDTLDEKGTFSS